MEYAWREQIYRMTDESKTHFANILQRIAALFLLLSNATHTRVEQDDINNYKDKDDNDDTTMANNNDFK